MDEGSWTSLVASNCATGLEFYTDTDSGGGTFTGSLAGCATVACGTGVTITGDHKVKLTGGNFADLNFGAVINGTNAQVILTGTRWQADNAQAIQVNRAANVLIAASEFSRPAAVAAPLVSVDNCTTVTLNGSDFLPGSTGIQLGSGVARAIISGNSFEDGGITNLMTSGKFIVASNLITASSPSGLVAAAGNAQVALSWAAALGATNYNVKRSLTSGGSYSNIATTAAITYTNTGLADGTTYYYVVSALRASGESDNSGTGQRHAELGVAERESAARRQPIVVIMAGLGLHSHGVCGHKPGSAHPVAAANQCRPKQQWQLQPQPAYHQRRSGVLPPGLAVARNNRSQPSPLR